MPLHRVRRRQNLDSIARQYRVHREDIWGAPENDELRARREHPDLLHEGDVVFVPDRDPQREPIATTRTHRFVVRRRMVPLAVRFRSGSAPRASVPCVLSVDGGPEQATRLDDDGVLRHRVPATAGRVRVRLLPDTEAEEQFELQLRDLDPSSETRGLEQRLINLGLVQAEADGTMDERKQAALRAFQRSQGLHVTGQLDAPTLDALRSGHAV